ncbi:hypothetical protein BS17DRAFT_777057 [Gyrodon lividus]|nr:hypothetical protein BS17DRAFT_777057 [Gyrodon lividus]
MLSAEYCGVSLSMSFARGGDHVPFHSIHPLFSHRYPTFNYDFDFYLRFAGSSKADTLHCRLGADEVQQGTHTTTYLYVRATKASILCRFCLRANAMTC